MWATVSLPLTAARPPYLFPYGPWYGPLVAANYAARPSGAITPPLAYFTSSHHLRYDVYPPLAFLQCIVSSQLNFNCPDIIIPVEFVFIHGGIEFVCGSQLQRLREQLRAF